VSAAHEEMSSSAPPPRSAGQAVAVFFIFAIAGPPLGALTLFAIATVVNPPTSFGQIGTFFSGIGLVIAFSYVFGGLQAAGVGLVAAISRRLGRRERVPLSPVLLASFFTGAAFVVILFSRPEQQPSATIGILAWMMATHFGAGIGCWLIANLLLRPPRQPALATP
jgi:hypothetical protein